MFYVYEWFIVDTLEVFYVGKGTGNRRYELHNRSKWFKAIYDKYKCDVRIVYAYLTNEESCELEKERIAEMRAIGQAKCNFTEGGTGFSTGALNPIHKRIKSGEENYFAQHIFAGEDNHMTGKKHTEETKRRISQSRKGKGGRHGADNPMYGKGFKGEENPMFGRTGLKHHNSKAYKITYKDGSIETLHHSGCAKKFGIAFVRIHKTGGILTYKKKTANDIYEGAIVEVVETCND